LIFGRHDLINDAPISRIDLLTCRNTLMYLNAETQTRVLTRLHFALREGGFLLLGRAETLMTQGHCVVAADLKRRLYRKGNRRFLGDHALPPSPVRPP
jgi:two-component system CheB/CheR fusion protein